MNKNITAVELDNGVLELPDVVNVETVPALLKRVEKDQQRIKIVDFSAVTQADSVALALLLKWQSDAGQMLQIRDLPTELETLIHLYDLEGTLQQA